jgi:sodium-dependent dicarboxylate transporter 2/3/5
MKQATFKRVSLVVFPILFLLFSTVLNPSEENPLIGKMLGIAIWMAGWWITEAVPIAVASLLPLVLFPLAGISSGKDVSGSYVNDIIFLFIGGFIIALAIEKWDVHRRIALRTLLFFGKGLFPVLVGFMAISAFLSMWISNTATALLMLPLVLSVIDELEALYSKKAMGKFKIALLLGIAYSCSIGGITTLIGTPPNLVFTKIFSNAYPNAPEITFANWLIFALPITLILFVIAVVVLYIIFRPKQQLKAIKPSFFEANYKALGKRTFEQSMVLVVFALFVFLLIFRADISIGNFTIPGWRNLFPQPKYIVDAVVAIFIAVLLFVIPSREDSQAKLMDWKTAVKLPWGIVLLFGGGFALAKGFQSSGLSEWIGQKLIVLSGSPLLIIILGCAVLMAFLTEFTSNVATTQALLPLSIALASSLQVNPMYLMIPLTMAASLAFMLPVATAPNAIVFGSNQLKIKQMLLPGFILNCVGIIVMALMMYFWGSYVFDLAPNSSPDWAK